VVTRRNVVWLVAVLAAGVVVGVLAGWLWGVAAAIVTLVVSEIVERTRRARVRRARGDATRVGVRDVVGSRRRR
jgi:TctA family transporter